MSFLKKLKNSMRYSLDSIYGSAFLRSAALQKLSNLQIPIAEHLFKVTHYPAHEAYTGWIKELRAWNGQLRLLHKGKKGSGNYTRKTLWQALWEEPLGEEADRIEIAAQLTNDGFAEVPIDEKKLRAQVEKFVADVLDKTPGHRYLPKS